jgi:hypothetical protein
VVASLRVAFGYDDVAQHKADGYDVSCCVLSADGGIEGDKEEMWKGFDQDDLNKLDRMLRRQ